MDVRRRKNKSKERDSNGQGGVDNGAPVRRQRCCSCCCFLSTVFWLAFISATAGGFFWLHLEGERKELVFNNLLEQRIASVQAAQNSQIKKEITSSVKSSTSGFVSSDQLDQFGSDLRKDITDRTESSLSNAQAKTDKQFSEIKSQLQKAEREAASTSKALEKSVASIKEENSGLQEQVQQAVSSGTQQLASREELQQLQQSSQQQLQAAVAEITQKLEQVSVAAIPDLTKLKEELFTDLENYFKLRFVTTEGASQLKQDLGAELLGVVDQTYAKVQDTAAEREQSERHLAALTQELIALKSEIIQSQPAQSEPAQPEPAQQEPAQQEPAQQESVQQAQPTEQASEPSVSK